jgi:hypothetical protein
VNASVTYIDLNNNNINDEGASALVDALKVNTAVTTIHLHHNAFDESNRGRIDELMARNKRLRHLFLFDARRMLLSVTCSDLCSVVLPYLLNKDDIDAVVALGNVETIRAEFAAVVEERRRRAAAALRLVAADVDVDEESRPAVKRRRKKR